MNIHILFRLKKIKNYHVDYDIELRYNLNAAMIVFIAKFNFRCNDFIFVKNILTGFLDEHNWINEHA